MTLFLINIANYYSEQNFDVESCVTRDNTKALKYVLQHIESRADQEECEYKCLCKPCDINMNDFIVGGYYKCPKCNYNITLNDQNISDIVFNINNKIKENIYAYIFFDDGNRIEVQIKICDEEMLDDIIVLR